MTVKVTVMTKTDRLGEDLEKLHELGSHFGKILWQFVKMLDVEFPYSLAFPLLKKQKHTST